MNSKYRKQKTLCLLSPLGICPLFFLLTFFSCTTTIGKKTASPLPARQQAREENMLSGEFKKTVDLVKTLIGDNQYDHALTVLYKIEQDRLNKYESAFWSYLTSLNHYYKGQYDISSKILVKATKNPNAGPFLKNQILYYLGLSQYKLGNKNQALTYFTPLEYKQLNIKNITKIIKIKEDILGPSRIDKNDFAEILFYFHSFTDWEVLKADEFFQKYSPILKNLSEDKKLALMEKDSSLGKEGVFDNFILYNLAQGAIYSPDNTRFNQYLEGLKKRSPQNKEQGLWVQELTNQYESFVRLKMGKIGVVLPLSGPKEKFGKRIVNGLNAAIEAMKEKRPDLSIQLIYKDSQGSTELGKEKIQELVKQEGVSSIIGGLFPQEGSSEYLQAKESGVFFISLSTLYLSSSVKNMLLVEIPGSLESLTYHFQNTQVKETLGEKGGIIYLGDEKGQMYFSSFWNQTQRANIRLEAIDSIDPTQNDYTQAVERVLGLRYPRERMEEKRLVEEINSLYPAKNAKKLPTLSPVVDFQWLFLPLLPDVASAVIPIFRYYDAQNIKFVGGPSWRSPLLQGTSKNRPLYFFDSDIKTLREKTTQFYTPLFQEAPGLLEMNAFEALFASYSLMDAMAQKSKSIQGAGGEWFLDDQSLWIKKMTLFSYKNAQIRPAF